MKSEARVKLETVELRDLTKRYYELLQIAQDEITVKNIRARLKKLNDELLDNCAWLANVASIKKSLKTGRQKSGRKFFEVR